MPHHSRDPASTLRPGAAGCGFKPEATPRRGETILPKEANCAFIGTRLEATLREAQIGSIVMVGFTTNHCVDASARVAGDLGFAVYVVSDASAAFERVSRSGDVLGADHVHEAALANLNQEFATVLDTNELVESLPSARPLIRALRE